MGNHGEESPGSTEIWCRITSGGGDPRESATESRPPLTAKAERGLSSEALAQEERVKGCGKSAPRDRQRKRHGKPHQEQDQVGAVRRRKPARRISALPPGSVARGVR